MGPDMCPAEEVYTPKIRAKQVCIRKSALILTRSEGIWLMPSLKAAHWIGLQQVSNRLPGFWESKIRAAHVNGLSILQGVFYGSPGWPFCFSTNCQAV